MFDIYEQDEAHTVAGQRALRADTFVGGVEPEVGRSRRARLRPTSSATSASRARVMAPIWSYDSLDMPSLSATRCALRAEVPWRTSRPPPPLRRGRPLVALDDVLGDQPHQLPQVDRPVPELRHRRPLLDCFLLDSPLRLLSFPRIRYVAIPDSWAGAAPFKAISDLSAYTNIFDAVAFHGATAFSLLDALSNSLKCKL